MASYARFVVVVLCLSMVVGGQALVVANDFTKYVTNGIQYSTDGTGVTLSLLEGQSTTGMGTTGYWLYGSFGAWIKLPGGNAAGTVATLYMASPFPQQCEYDFEFLGNVTGEKRVCHTNVFVDGKGGREQQIYFPGDMDPTAAYHYYSFEWHEDQVVFYIDWKPVRQFKNLKGIVNNGTFCDHKGMGLYLSIWDGSNWATEGGLVKVDWLEAPFEAQYTNFNLDGCPYTSSADVAGCQADPHSSAVPLTDSEIQYMKNIRSNSSVVHYNYCDDSVRFPDITAAHPECAYNAM